MLVIISLNYVTVKNIRTHWINPIFPKLNVQRNIPKKKLANVALYMSFGEKAGCETIVCIHQ